MHPPLLVLLGTAALLPASLANPLYCRDITQGEPPWADVAVVDSRMYIFTPVTRIGKDAHSLVQPRALPQRACAPWTMSQFVEAAKRTATGAGRNVKM
jgi:hypothetical protein